MSLDMPFEDPPVWRRISSVVWRAGIAPSALAWVDFEGQSS
jgi:hypothetical protein